MIGSIPGPIVFGAVLDRACIVWNVECGETGSCAAYNNHDLAMGIFSLNLSMKVRYKRSMFLSSSLSCYYLSF